MARSRLVQASALGALALGLLATAACHPKQAPGGVAAVFGEGPIVVASRLDCPASVDRLSRTSQSPDGQVCSYAGPQGETVELSLMALAGQTPQSRLAGLEQTLKSQLGPIDGGGGGANAVRIDADGDHDQANIDLPGFHLHANGGKADIQMPGVSVDADGDKANVRTGWGRHVATVNADGSGAEVRTGQVDASGANLTYVLASNAAGPTGLRAAGYIAKGPAAGPLVVAVFRASRNNDQHGLGDHGLQRLVDLNAHRA